MPEKVSILLSHVVSHLVEYSSLKTMFALKALPQYLLTPDVNNFHVKVSSFLCWYFFFFFALWSLKTFPYIILSGCISVFCCCCSYDLTIGCLFQFQELFFLLMETVYCFFISPSLFSLFFPLTCITHILYLLLLCEYLLAFLLCFPSFVWIDFPNYVSRSLFCF